MNGSPMRVMQGKAHMFLYNIQDYTDWVTLHKQLTSNHVIKVAQ